MKFKNSHIQNLQRIMTLELILKETRDCLDDIIESTVYADDIDLGKWNGLIMRVDKVLEDKNG